MIAPFAGWRGEWDEDRRPDTLSVGEGNHPCAHGATLKDRARILPIYIDDTLPISSFD